MYKRVKVIVKNPVQLVMPTRKKRLDILQELVKNDILFSSDLEGRMSMWHQSHHENAKSHF